MSTRQQPTAKPAVTPAHAGVLHRTCGCGRHTSGGGGACVDCRRSHDHSESRRPEAVAEVPPIVDRVLRSRGEPLGDGARAFMEPRFGHDFSRVRIHTDAEAGQSAHEIDALAYTAGRHVVFGNGQYQPHSHAGRRLLAHELTHVLQHSTSEPAGQPLRIDSSNSLFEQEAHRTSASIAGAETAASVPAAGRATQRLSRQEASTTASGSGAPQAPPIVLQDTPVTFVAEPIISSPALSGGRSGQTTSVGMAMHILASGDVSWLPKAEGASRILSTEYWSPLLPPGRNIVTLDRVTNTLPRNLAPGIEGELASGQPLSWLQQVDRTGGTFTEAEIKSIPDLARRFNTNQALTETEISLLARATETHVGSSSSGSPFASYTKPNTELAFNYKYRVRVEMPGENALNVSEPNAITNRWKIEKPNVEEMEFMAIANHEGKIVSVERLAGTTKVGPLIRYSGAIRWGGRVMIVVGLAISAYRIATAKEGERLKVVGEEGGALAGGIAGTALVAAGCVAFGIATGGIGLLVCGLVGGGLGAMAGSAIGGGIADELGNMGKGGTGGGTPCPSCHALQRQWEARRQFSGLQAAPVPGGRLEPLSADGKAPGTRALTAQEKLIIQHWLDTTRTAH